MKLIEPDAHKTPESEMPFETPQREIPTGSVPEKFKFYGKSLPGDPVNVTLEPGRLQTP